MLTNRTFSLAALNLRKGQRVSTFVKCSVCQKAHQLSMSRSAVVSMTFCCVQCGTAMIVNPDLSTSRLMDRMYDLSLQALRHGLGN